ncbi:MAG: methylated-DNA--[protein]-cysteine S-methyltransferase, partial [Veillonella sp.]
ILQTISYGNTTTYGAIGKQIAQQQDKEKFSAQAVGGAVGHNPISIIIPCHRVIGSNGKLTGYAGGIERKKYMLDLEAKHK